jgi:hypothetical protein
MRKKDQISCLILRMLILLHPRHLELKAGISELKADLFLILTRQTSERFFQHVFGQAHFCLLVSILVCSF